MIDPRRILYGVLVAIPVVGISLGVQSYQQAVQSQRSTERDVVEIRIKAENQRRVANAEIEGLQQQLEVERRLRKQFY